jgi:phosphoribosylformylglycinamidine synthase I
MKSAVIVFPASNCDRDAHDAILHVTGQEPQMVWHGDSEVPNVDLIVLPGGFSYGDYLRCGAMAAHSHIMGDIKRKADQGVAVLGICNGFQILTEARLLPGMLMRNAGLKFVCLSRSRMAKAIFSPATMFWIGLRGRAASRFAMPRARTPMAPPAISRAFSTRNAMSSV